MANKEATQEMTIQEANELGLTDAATWEEYVENIADDHGVGYDTAHALFDMLGISEAFDGFVTAMEDAEGYDMESEEDELGCGF